MEKRIFTVVIFIWISFFARSAFAQLTNSGEDYSAYIPEARSTNSYLAQMPQGPSLLTKEVLLATRKYMLPDSSVKLQVKPVVKQIKGSAGNLSLRIFKPAAVRAVVLSIHGGGFFLGNAGTDDAFHDYLATTCNVAVVSVDYRLAPENPFPAGIEDCKAAAKWLVENVKKEFGTDKIFISGPSAGAHLSAVIAIYIRDSLHAINKVKGVNLMYGCYDLARTPSYRKATDSTLMINKRFIDESYQLVFPGWDQERLQNPQFSPLYADLKNLPPALFTIGTKDPLIDDTYFMEARWRLAGNKTYLAAYPESPHGFNFFPTKMAAAANKKICDWIMSLCGQ